MLLEGIEEALRLQIGTDGAATADDDEKLAALAAARVAALTEEEGAALLPPSPRQQQQQQLLLLEPLALGVRLEAGAVARLLEGCRRRRRRRRTRGDEAGGGEEQQEESSLLLLLESTAAAASARLAPPPPPPPPPPSAEEEEEKEEEEGEHVSSEADGPSSSLVRWSTENGASVSFEARSWRRTRATTTTRKTKSAGEDPSLSSTSSSSSLLRGAAATRDISPGQEVARIPFDNLIHARMLASTDAGRAIGALKLPDEGEALLAFTLLDAADEESPRAPLWDSLRPTFSSLRTALNATEEEIALLDERTPARRLAASWIATSWACCIPRAGTAAAEAREACPLVAAATARPPPPLRRPTARPPPPTSR